MARQQSKRNVRVQTNDDSQMREYRGVVLDTVMATLNVIHGGMVVTDAATFHGINTRLPDLARAVPTGPNHALLLAQSCLLGTPPR